MRFYTQQHRYYCGIDLHARSVYLCIMDQAGEILLHRNMRANPNSFLKAVAPYREDLVLTRVSVYILDLLSDRHRLVASTNAFPSSPGRGGPWLYPVPQKIRCQSLEPGGQQAEVS